MKHLLRLTTLLAIVLATVSCNKTPETTEPSLDVTANNISGIWKVSEWSGKALDEGTYVYIEFTRRDQLFTMYDNLTSFSAHKSTGRYNLYIDEEFGAIIRGEYDFARGDDKSWAHRYIIQDLKKDKMIWIAKDDLDDITVYERCDAIPAEILAEISDNE